MGFARAVGRGYVHMFNVGGRARRSEYWWFFVWQLLAGAAIGAAFGFYAATNPEQVQSWIRQIELSGSVPGELWTYWAYYMAANFILFWVPGMTVLVRRLHDTDRSGFWYFISLVPFIGFIWLIVLLCLPGTHGNNRFGPDSAPDRKVPPPAHPAFAAELQGEERDRAEIARRAAARDYYKRRVLPSIHGAEGT
ncbi:DUF805 domain-containing protein [Hasllibacter sp. MH4015]|uniref:DUF805 domain-containing protein n=1 Tax=Hasllibacter sp. MH4015 TaxID=2854029 RepID=UPI001CD58FF5|nr:DUF805 domain-containing protein [Hasllibacter sp. MH4015]